MPINNGQVNIHELSNCFEHLCVFDSNIHANKNQYTKTSKIIAIGAIESITIEERNNALASLQQFLEKEKRWIFGYLTYDLKNNIEQLTSNNDDSLLFPLLHFFVPEVVIQIGATSVILSYNDTLTSVMRVNEIFNLAFQNTINTGNEDVLPISVKPKISKEQYIDTVNKLKQHIHKGNIYEVNYCQEFYANNIRLNTVKSFEKLNQLSQAPFSAYCKFNNHYVLCASPERYIQKQGNKLISQPIKGTIKRSQNKEKDEQLKQQLQNNRKERSENVMIVDLVRNDFSRIAKQGSVHVEELFGIYSFKQWHQMISTISCELEANTTFSDIIKSTFPMGSMTGAPKVSAMQLIEEYEQTKRGLYSGAIGYINPDGDFDFNVVIRSILYNSENNYASFMVGSAITDKAIAEEEYEECILKAKAMFEVFQHTH